MKIFPGITAFSKKELDNQFRRVSWARKIHMDVMDGMFVEYKTSYRLVKKAQVHLMVKNAQKCFARAKEVIIHAESSSPFAAVVKAKKLGIKTGIAFNPSTRVSKELVKVADFALVMTVEPGASGQKMKTSALRKIKQIKRIKRIPVGVDGGVNRRTIKFARKAGADFVVTTSAVTLAQNPRKEFLALTKLA
ncbi:MAG TPA: hypothetical protein VJJ82_00545 [Candidatus Nanoarchaeia archaeon]|nr:hypothetical protein [Candidatus Nanoarchaeia archaeon]